MILKILETHFTPDGDHEVARFECVKQLAAAYDELSNWKEGSAGRMEEAVTRMMHLYQALARESIREDPAWIAWRWFPNFHMLLHLCAQAHIMGNPRSWWCYLDESEIGMSVDVAESAHILTFAKTVLVKHVIWMELEDPQ